jgi:hypothetical protein
VGIIEHRAEGIEHWSDGVKMNLEVGPVVVPKERDYAAARMRKWELQGRAQRAWSGGEFGREKIEGEKLGSWEGERGEKPELGVRRTAFGETEMKKFQIEYINPKSYFRNVVTPVLLVFYY